MSIKEWDVLGENVSTPGRLYERKVICIFFDTAYNDTEFYFIERSLL